VAQAEEVEEVAIDSPHALLHWLWRAQVKWTRDSLDQDLQMDWFSDDGYDYSTSALALAELMYDFVLDQRYGDLYALLLTDYNQSINDPERQLWDYATDGVAPEFHIFPALKEMD
jgi:hypothetical protein